MNIKDLVNEIKNRLIIEEVIGSYIHLKKVGRNYVALCPFHHEKTPSFTVSPEKNFFHCFGCGKSGDVITFVAEIEKISFIEAVKKLAVKAGIDPSPYFSGETPKEKSLISSIQSINTEAMKFFKYCLLKSKYSKDAIRYLKSRGINSEIAKVFKFGFAPPGGSMLYKYLKSRYFTDESIFESRLVTKTSKGPIDLFRNRIIIPIMDQYGIIVGFAGRKIDDSDNSPKYINTPETPLFKKRNILFGFYQAKDSIIETKRVYIVEGYFDVISLYSRGIRNVVAPMGTALTLEQMRLLSNKVNEIYLFFDNDSAGIKATQGTLQLILSNNLASSAMKIKIIHTPFKDPDEFIKNSQEVSDETLQKYSYDMIDFFLKVRHDEVKSGDSSTIMRFILSMFDIISLVSNVYEKEEMLRKLSEGVGVSIEVMRGEFEKYQSKKFVSRDVFISNFGKLVSGELELLIAYFVSKNHNLFDTLLSELNPDDFKDELVRYYLSFLEEYLFKEEVSEGDLNELYILESEIESRATELSRNVGTSISNEEFDTLLALYKVKRISERKKEIQKIIENVMKSNPDQELIDELLEEKQALAIEEKKIKEGRGINYLSIGGD
jgi:DNA primase